jgi:tripartite-type tricarboxylate transporter receptor subunit TctC
MIVHPSVAAKSLKEFIALAKAKPGAINHATTGTGNLLGIELFKHMAGINMVNVPYKGTGQAVLALVAGEVQFFIMNPIVAIPNMKTGKLRGLAVTSLARNTALPDLPTVDESAVPGYKNITWHSVIVPAGTPQPIQKKLNAELVRIVNLPDVKEFFQGQGLTPVGSTPEQLAALIKEESKEYGKLVKQIGYQPQ